MNVNNISFKANLIEQMQQKAQPAAATAATIPTVQKDYVELSAESTQKKPSKKTIAGIVTAGVLLIIAFVKRKAIGNFFKRLFNKAKSQTDEIKQETKKAKESSKGTATRTAEKIEFPVPKFTCGPENPEKYALEKKAYVDSIMPYLYKRDKQLKIKAIEAIEKYGSWEHGDKLGLFLGKRDEDIVVPVVRAIAATGGARQSLLINAFIRNPKTEYKSVNTYIEILKALSKLGNIKGWSQRESNFLLNPIKRLTKSENKEVAQAAKDALNTILNK